VASAPVVDPLDPVADSEPGRSTGRPRIPVVELDFQCRPEGFGRSIIPALTGAPNRTRRVMPIGEPRQLRGGVRTAAVGVKPDPA
jgi:hypothetical protein